MKNFSEWDQDVLSLDSKEELFSVTNEGDKQCIILQFILKKSSYATMVVREFLSNNISFDY